MKWSMVKVGLVINLDCTYFCPFWSVKLFDWGVGRWIVFYLLSRAPWGFPVAIILMPVYFQDRYNGSFLSRLPNALLTFKYFCVEHMLCKELWLKYCGILVCQVVHLLQYCISRKSKERYMDNKNSWNIIYVSNLYFWILFWSILVTACAVRFALPLINLVQWISLFVFVPEFTPFDLIN